jgi:cytoskeletal protein RodZ
METLGQILKRYRESAGFSEADFSKLSKIPPKIIRSLEADNLAELPEDFFVRGYIKNYSKYLGLDYEMLVKRHSEFATHVYEEKKQFSTSAPQKIFITPKKIKILILVVVGLSLISYLAFQVRGIFEPPTISIQSPAENIIVETPYIELIGSTEKEAQVFINAKEIIPDASGVFHTTLDLLPGLNLIKVSAKKKYSKERIKYLEILLK